MLAVMMTPLAFPNCQNLTRWPVARPAARGALMDDVGGENLAVVLADWGRPISTPAGSGLALVDQQSRLSSSGRHVTTFATVTAPAALLRGLVAGDQITVDGVAATVEQPALSAADGALLVVLCRVD
jgi:hypothetical protein